MSDPVSLEAESESKDRKSLQQYLKSKGLSATGTTAVLRARYVQARGSEVAGVTIDLTGDDSPVPIKKKAPPAKKKAPPVAANKKRAAASSDEKRLKRYRTTCSGAVRQRIQRAKTQRLFLVDRPQEDDNGHKFCVMGSTGNLYTVKISKLVHCSCPDHAKGNVCKHILFVMLKVIGLPDTSPLIYQTALLTSELEEITQQLQLRRNSVGPRVMANARVQKAYQEMTSPAAKTDTPAAASPENDSNKRQQIEGDCAICFDEMACNQDLVFCRAVCGANFHAACMNHWKRANKHNTTCPNCRSAWQEEEQADESAKSNAEDGYANLGQLQGQPGNGIPAVTRNGTRTAIIAIDGLDVVRN
ncbi:kinase kinase [Seminavis robusta]|uniref:Kinase kinase n=1 Tax=Seminavis robusta TaxID=568900 RepID=A0A9N8EUD9_9STRA|nr:kinase kinase [Seminavis robusta]|eukprot:Sro1790_g297710.1 kinase kinase (359) ;mRNA; r:3929-5005